ncbi:MAG: arsenic transporter, partial [Archangium sp.]|nr:arsenic transporter [Archangium sp.]
RERFPVEPIEIAEGLRGVMLLARTGQEMFLSSVIHSATIARLALQSDALRRLLQAGPSFKEMGVYFQLLTALRAKRSDGAHENELIVIDMPATGHTLSLTGLPELLLRLVPRGPIAEALREGKTYLNDPAQAAAVVVAIPETLPVTECLELLEGLRSTSMHAAAVVMNRVPADPFTPSERAALDEVLTRTPTLGVDGFRRPKRSHEEIARLRAATSVPIRLVPELPQAGLIGAVAEALA